MKRLYVGCRVRIVAADELPEVVGREARIIAYEEGDEAPWDLDIDGLGSRWPTGETYAAASDEIEPILPEGHQACDTDFKQSLDNLLERQGVVA